MNLERNDKGCVKFTDTTGINYDIWTKILIRFNYLGYGLPDIDCVKKYIDKGCFLQPDQSKEVLIILGLEHETETYSKDRIEEDNQKAKEHFGTTQDIRLAGYLLTDGAMLNLSYQGYQRDMDHREISNVIEVDNSDSASGGLIQFVSYGNIRLLTSGFELSKRPTERQRSVLSSYIRRNPEIYVDISNNQGHVIKTLEYDYALPSQVLSDIDVYFDSLIV